MVNTTLFDQANMKVYLGGNFNYIGPEERFGGVIDLNTQEALVAYDNPNDQVTHVISDGNNGWFIAGNFTAIGGVSRPRVAHLNSSGQLTPWAVNLNGPVTSLYLDGGTLYLGGNFSLVNSTVRNNVAAVDATTGVLLSWNPDANAPVYSILKDASKVYLGGVFNVVGGNSHSRLASVDAVTGAVDTWNPTMNDTVYDIKISGNQLVVAGSFNNVNSTSRNRLAVFDLLTGTLATNNPSFNSTVRSLAIYGDTVIAGGHFTSVMSNTRAGLAAYALSTNSVLSWNPAPNTSAHIYSVSLSGTQLAVGGTFTSIGGAERFRIALLDINSGNLLPLPHVNWSNNSSSLETRVNAVSLVNGKLYAGGFFASLGGWPRLNFAVLDAITGKATSTDLRFNSDVATLHKSGDVLYCGGAFSLVNGQSRSSIASIHIPADTLTSWSPTVGGWVYSIAVGNGKVFLGGDFSTVGGQPRSNLAQVDSITGFVTGWDPNVTGSTSVSVKSIVLRDSLLYIGGQFTAVGGQSRPNFASIDIFSGVPSPFAPVFNASVRSISILDSMMYIGGSFSTVNGQTRSAAARFNLNNLTLTNWAPSANSYLSSVDAKLNRVLVAGTFSTLNSQTQIGAALVNSTIPGLTQGWNPILGTNANVSVGKIYDSLVFIGGTFLMNTQGVTGRYNFAVYAPCLSTPAPTATSPQDFCNSGTVGGLVASGTNVSWYTTPNGGSALAANTALINGNTYYAAQTVNNCESYTRVPVVVNIQTPAAPTGTTPQQFCQGATLANIVMSGQGIQWYTSLTSTTPLSPSTLLVNNVTRYASQTINGCESVSRTPITVTVTTVPAPTGALNQTFCNTGNLTLANIIVNGTQITWYDSLTGGNVLPITTPLTTATSYYATQTLNNCESYFRFQVNVTISTTSAPTGISPQNVCDPATLSNLTVVGTNIKWYAADTGGVALPVSTSLVNGQTYYASQTVSACESYLRTPILVNVTVVNPPTGTSPQTLCSGSTLSNVVVSGQNILWYPTSTSATPLPANTVLVNGENYFCTQSNGNCVSTRTMIVTNLSPDITVTNSSPTLSANQTGAQYQWIDCSNNTPIANATGQSFTATSNGSYAVIVTVGACSDTSICLPVNNVSVHDITKNPFLQLFPNPNTGGVTLRAETQGILVVRDMTGKKLVETNFKQGDQTINLSHLAAGIYMVESWVNQKRYAQHLQIIQE